MVRILLVVASCAAVLLIIDNCPCLADNEYNLLTLKGIQRVAVIIDELPKDARDDGLRSRQLRADVESRLREVGIEIVASGDTTHPYSPPRLYVNVHAEKTRYCGYAASLRVRLQQGVLLLQNAKDSAWATTWHADLAGVVPVHKMSSTAREWLDEIVDQLIGDYLVANPDKAASK